MPDICLFNKRMIIFLVGFRNYLGEEKFSDTNSGESVALPNSNLILVTFPKIMDNPDVLEAFLTFWNNVIVKKMKDKDKYNITKLLELTESYVSKLYPVVYNTTFDLSEHNIVKAAECFLHNPDLKSIRRTMVMNALNDRRLDFVDKSKLLILYENRR